MSARSPRRRAAPPSSGPDSPEFPTPNPHLKKAKSSNFSTINLWDEEEIALNFGPAGPALEPGATVGNIKIIEKIGEGSQSAIYRGYQPTRDRVVAVKVLSPESVESDDRVRGFHREADLASRVYHPGLVASYGWEFDSGLHFYPMKLMEGPTLHEFIQNAFGKRGDLFFKEAASLFADLCRAVAELHSNDVAHLDIRPSNMFLESGERLVLGSFAAARDVREWSKKSRTQDEEIDMTTLAYWAPERFVQSPARRSIDFRNDIYSLGMSLYELLTGVLPFPDCDMANMARLKLTRKPPSPRQHLAEVPLGLEAVVRQALDIHLELRYQNAGEMARDLDRFSNQRRTGTRKHPSDSTPTDYESDEDTLDGPDPQPAPIS